MPALLRGRVDSSGGISENKCRIALLRSNREGETNMAAPEDMWQCQTVNCGYIYDPDRGDRKGKIPKGTRFEDLPGDWKCPICGAGKKMFRPLAGPGSVAAEGR
jgi:rubredoxin